MTYQEALVKIMEFKTKLIEPKYRDKYFNQLDKDDLLNFNKIISKKAFNNICRYTKTELKIFKNDIDYFHSGNCLYCAIYFHQLLWAQDP